MDGVSRRQTRQGHDLCSGVCSSWEAEGWSTRCSDGVGGGGDTACIRVWGHGNGLEGSTGAQGECPGVLGRRCGWRIAVGGVVDGRSRRGGGECQTLRSGRIDSGGQAECRRHCDDGVGDARNRAVAHSRGHGDGIDGLGAVHGDGSGVPGRSRGRGGSIRGVMDCVTGGCAGQSHIPGACVGPACKAESGSPCIPNGVGGGGHQACGCVGSHGDCFEGATRIQAGDGSVVLGRCRCRNAPVRGVVDDGTGCGGGQSQILRSLVGP